MFGKNPVRKQDLNHPYHLRVQEIFATIQGEGPFAGRPAIFIRLAGCNLRCHFCDTDFESNYDRTPLSIGEIVNKVLELNHERGINLVVITGGEPLLQNLQQLLPALASNGFHSQIETAGTVWQPGLSKHLFDGQATLVCSPKTSQVHKEIADWCDHWKYIISASEFHGKDGLPMLSTQKKGYAAHLFRPRMKQNTRIYLQPCDEGNEAENRRNQALAAALAMDHGYILSIQIHKILGMP